MPRLDSGDFIRHTKITIYELPTYIVTTVSLSFSVGGSHLIVKETDLSYIPKNRP